MSLLAQTPAVPVESAGHSVLQIIFGLVYVIVCILLIVAILSRTTKNEGLSGSMMGGADTSTAFRGAKSTEDTVDTITNGVAVAFVVLSIALNYVF